MLHKRYDWRRPIFWSALCLSLFFSSQTKSVKKGELETDRTVRLIEKAQPSALYETGEESPYYNNLTMYLFVAK